MLKRKLKLKISAVFAVGIIMIMLAIFPAIFVYTQYHEINNLWHEDNQQEVIINKALTQLNRNIGYGGFIHNFKNLILRGDLNRYQKPIEKNIVEIHHQIEEIEKLVGSAEEHNALQQLRITFDLYKDMYEKSKRSSSFK